MTSEQEKQWRCIKPYILDRLYVSRKEGRRLASIENSVCTSIRRPQHNIKSNKERLNTVTKKSTNKTYINWTIARKQIWEEKQLHGHFKRQINEISHEKTWAWLRNGNLKRKTQSLLIATQNNIRRTNYAKGKIDKAQKK